MSNQTIRAAAFAATALKSVSACNYSPAVDEAPVLHLGYWQATISLPGGDIEAGIE